MPRISDAERANRRAHLVATAWACLAEHAYRDLTVDDICIAAGVSKGAFYGYFKSKQELLYALHDEDASTLDTLIEELSSRPLTAGERLRRFARASLRDAENPSRMQLRGDLLAALGTDPAVEESLRSSARSRRAALRGWVEQGSSSGELKETPANAFASIVIALADGLALHHTLDPSGFQWRNVEAALDILIAGVETAPDEHTASSTT